MKQPAPMPDFVDGFEKLVAIFGYWPSFHDAEVLSVTYDREAAYPFSIRLAVHTWASTGEVDEKGYYRLVNHTRVEFLFEDCDQVELHEFNQQNVIYGLKLDLMEGDHPVRLDLEPCYGLHGSLRCRRARIVSAVPYLVPRG